MQTVLAEWPLQIWSQRTQATKAPSKQRFSLLNDAQNVFILILHAIFADNKEIDENR